MKAKKRLEITWETHEITTISFKGRISPEFFCQVCQAETLAFTPGQVAKFLQISEPEVLRQIELGELHLVMSNNALVCVLVGRQRVY